MIALAKGYYETRLDQIDAQIKEICAKMNEVIAQVNATLADITATKNLISTAIEDMEKDFNDKVVPSITFYLNEEAKRLVAKNAAKTEEIA